MSAAPAISTSKSRERANRPNQFGMHPAMAARLIALGVDPEERARAVRDGQGSRLSRTTSAAPAVARRALFSGGGGAELSLDPSDVRLAPLLNQAALQYRNAAMIGDNVAPVQLVSERSATYKIWGRDDDLEGPDDLIGPNGTAKEVEPTLSDDNYSVKARALKGFTSNDTEMANPSLGVRARTVENVRKRLAIKREIRIADAFNLVANYTTAANVRALGAAFKWNGGASADPIADVLYCLEQIQGVDVTDAVMSDIIWHVAQQNAQLKAILASQINNQGILRPMDFGLYFGIPNLWISKTMKRTAAGTRVRVWSEANLWIGVVDTAPDTLTFARTFRLRQGAGGWISKSWRDEDRGENGGEWNRIAYAEDVKIVAPTYGTLITGVKQ